MSLDNLREICADFSSLLRTWRLWLSILHAYVSWRLRGSSENVEHSTYHEMNMKRKLKALQISLLKQVDVVWVGGRLDAGDGWNIIMNTFWQIIMMMLDGWCCSCCGSYNENESHYYWSEFMVFLRVTRDESFGFGDWGRFVSDLTSFTWRWLFIMLRPILLFRLLSFFFVPHQSLPMPFEY